MVGCRPDAHGGGARAKELIAANSSGDAKDGHLVMNDFFVYWIVTEDSRDEDHEVVSRGTWGTFPDTNSFPYVCITEDNE